MTFSKEALFNIDGMHEASGAVTVDPRGKIMSCFK
jgi:hypothetical protein